MAAKPLGFDRTLESRDPDVALMMRIQRDEAGAFQELIDLYWSRIFARFFRQFGDRQEAEDLAQDVFLRLFRNRKRYRPRARFTTWLYHIARNVGRNAIRGRRRRPAVPLARLEAMDDSPRFGHGRAASEIPCRSLERAEVAGMVRRAVAALRGRQRIAVELQCQDHSYREIGDKLAMSAKAAKSLLYRARNELRISLGPFTESLS